MSSALWIQLHRNYAKLADVHDSKTRSRNMAAIKGKNTKPELLIRSALHKEGFRFRLHRKELPGKPDLVLPKYNAVIFINGCFWHGHDCPMYRWPATRQEFWREKISRTKQRDQNNLATLQDANWRIATIWECALKGKLKLNFPFTVSKLTEWLCSDSNTLEIRGTGIDR